jgi:hypothetical protein
MMKRMQKEALSQIINGDFSQKSELHDFPREWLPIGGNKTSSWKYKQDDQNNFFLEVTNTSVIRAGIIQTDESSIDVRNNKHWLVQVSFRSDQTESKAYLRLYPTNSQGDISLPLEYWFKTRSRSKHYMQFKQTIHINSETKYLRLETGVEGPGMIELYKIIAYPLILKSFPSKNKKEQFPRLGEHIQSIGEIIKPIQLAMPIPLNIPVNVQAKVDSQIRNLTPLRDRVQIFGSGRMPLATTSCGRAQVEISGHGFQESFEDVTAHRTLAYTTIRDVAALSRYSYAIYNMGAEVACVQIQLSPDGLHWVNVGNHKIIDPNTLGMINPEGFLRYARVSYKAQGLTTLRIWVQAQN